MGNIVKDIRLWDDNPYKNSMPTVVKIEFKEKRDWCIFTVEELLQILRLWIKGEEKRYPRSKGFRGRWLLFDEIKKVFNENL